MDLTVNKGGISWAEFSISRHSKGLEIFVRTVPQIEDFIKSLGTGRTDSIEQYSSSAEWFPITGTTLLIHRTDKRSIYGNNWSLEDVGSTLVNSKDAGLKVNLSFLKIVGVGSNEGVRFGVKGPYSKEFINQFAKDVVVEIRDLVQQYIVPVHVNLRITSQDL